MNFFIISDILILLYYPFYLSLFQFLFNKRPRSLAASFVTNLRYFVPQTFFKFLISYLTWQKESMVNVTLSSLLHGHVVENSLYMAGDEMETVCELDEELYHEHLDKFIFYFSESDKWAPL